MKSNSSVRSLRAKNTPCSTVPDRILSQTRCSASRIWGIGDARIFSLALLAKNAENKQQLHLREFLPGFRPNATNRDYANMAKLQGQVNDLPSPRRGGLWYAWCRPCTHRRRLWSRQVNHLPYARFVAEVWALQGLYPTRQLQDFCANQPETLRFSAYKKTTKHRAHSSTCPVDVFDQAADGGCWRDVPAEGEG